MSYNVAIEGLLVTPKVQKKRTPQPAECQESARKKDESGAVLSMNQTHVSKEAQPIRELCH
jgi:hypothetical protein